MDRPSNSGQTDTAPAAVVLRGLLGDCVVAGAALLTAVDAAAVGPGGASPLVLLAVPSLLVAEVCLGRTTKGRSWCLTYNLAEDSGKMRAKSRRRHMSGTVGANHMCSNHVESRNSQHILSTCMQPIAQS